MSKVVCLHLLVLGALTSQGIADDPVYFPDANLKDAVEAELGISDPAPDDMLGLSELVAKYSDIAALEGLGHAANLTYLNLNYNQVSDVSALSNLTNLTQLELYENDISDISGLSSLVNLEILDLINNNISDISPLLGLTNLTRLYLQGNPLSQESCYTIIPQIVTTIPTIEIRYDPCPPLQYTLAISSTAGGSVTAPGEGSFGPYLKDTTVSLTAVHDSGYRFVNWTGDVATVADRYDPTTTIGMNGDYSIRAQFETVPTEYTMTTYVDPPDGGSVLRSPYKAFYSPGESVILTASPATDAGYVFSGWSGHLSGSTNPTTIIMDADKSITAEFLGCCERRTVCWRRHILEGQRVEAESGEWFIAERVGNVIEGRYWRPGWQTHRVIAKCWFPEGCSQIAYWAPQEAGCDVLESGAVPDCFHRFLWTNWDAGHDNCHPEHLDCIEHRYDVCLDKLTVEHLLYTYPEGCVPPIGVDGSCGITEGCRPYPRHLVSRSKPPLWQGPLGQSSDAFFSQADLGLCPETEVANRVSAGVVGHDIDDLDWDGDSDSVDFQLARDAFGTASGDDQYDPMVDLNGDGQVSHVDFALLYGVRWLDSGRTDTVDFTDFALLARYWLYRGCDTTAACRRVDVDDSGAIDGIDIALWAECWLMEEDEDAATLPIAHWKLDEGSGTLAVDSAGGNDGLVYGAVWSDGIIDGALRFDGMNDYVDCGSEAVLAPKKMTVAFWMRTLSLGQDRYILAKAQPWGYAEDYSARYLYSTRIQFAFGNSMSEHTNVATSQSWCNGGWTHFTAVRDGSQARVYLNGELEASQDYAFIPINQGQPLTFGARSADSSSELFEGELDDIRIYGRALSEGEIERLIESGQ